MESGCGVAPEACAGPDLAGSAGAGCWQSAIVAGAGALGGAPEGPASPSAGMATRSGMGAIAQPLE